MNDIRKLINIINETTASGGVAPVSQSMHTQHRVEEDYTEESSDKPQILEYGNWENSALTTSKKLKKSRKKASKIVKSVYGEDMPGEKVRVTESFGPLPKDNQQIRLGKYTVDIKRVGLNKNYIGFAWHDSKGQEHYEEVAVGDLGSYDDLLARIKGEIRYQERRLRQGVAEGSDASGGELQKVVDAAAKYGFKMSNRSKNGQKIILHNTDFHQWLTCRIRNVNGKIYIDYDESSNNKGLRNEVVTPKEFIQRLKNYYLEGQAWLEKLKKREEAEKNFVGIRVERYSYGKPSSGLRAAVKFLNRNGKRGHEYFDFPEYADIPDEISSELMPDEVDFIQDHWDEVPAGKQGVAEGVSAQDKNISVGDYVQTAAGVEGVVKHISPDGKKLTIWNRKRQADHRVDITKAEKIPGIARRKMAEQGVAEDQLNELSPELLARYRKAKGDEYDHGWKWDPEKEAQRQAHNEPIAKKVSHALYKELEARRKQSGVGPDYRPLKKDEQGVAEGSENQYSVKHDHPTNKNKYAFSTISAPDIKTAKKLANEKFDGVVSVQRLIKQQFAMEGVAEGRPDKDSLNRAVGLYRELSKKHPHKVAIKKAAESHNLDPVKLNDYVDHGSYSSKKGVVEGQTGKPIKPGRTFKFPNHWNKADVVHEFLWKKNAVVDVEYSYDTKKWTVTDSRPATEKDMEQWATINGGLPTVNEQGVAEAGYQSPHAKLAQLKAKYDAALKSPNPNPTTLRRIRDQIIKLEFDLGIKEGVEAASVKKDMTGQTCEKCKKDKYQERSLNDDRDGTLRCSCGHVVDRWRKYKKKDGKQGVTEGENIGGKRYDKIADLKGRTVDQLNKLIQKLEGTVAKYPDHTQTSEYLGLAKMIRAEKIGKKGVAISKDPKKK